ncbi:uncharacterized protein LOC117120331 isoform X1 [Anneissia japonica]|uniref:uncharacterized protein LOC117120331 isoform X1 n=1 Tax=Anneissia japonica TaxID=1529436 RepID=UPI0014255210|nr:uncharacterized protein LOC117120331 isoform X1 [Anneissia japonica]
MSGKLNIELPSSSSQASSPSPTNSLSPSIIPLSSSSSSTSSSVNSYFSLPSTSCNYRRNEDANTFEASSILSGMYCLVVVLFGVGICHATFIVKLVPSDLLTPQPELDSRYNNMYLAFLSAIGLLMMLSTFAYDRYLHCKYFISIVDTASSNTYLKAVNILFGFVTVVYMIIVAMTVLYKVPYSEAYESITWVCFYLAVLIYLDRYSHVCFKRVQIFKRFGIMHLLATNVVYVFEIVAFDTQEDYYVYYPKNLSICTLKYDPVYKGLPSIVEYARPFAAAFSAEYSLIAVCLLRSLWSNVGGTVIIRNTENISKRTYPIMESLYGILGGVVVFTMVLILGLCLFIKTCVLCWYYLVVINCIFGLGLLCTFICLLNTTLLKEDEEDGSKCTSTVIYDIVLLLFCLSLYILQTMYTSLAAIIQYKITHVDVSIDTRNTTIVNNLA